MKLVIAEKPSVAQSLARVIGATRRQGCASPVYFYFRISYPALARSLSALSKSFSFVNT